MNAAEVVKGVVIEENWGGELRMRLGIYKETYRAG